MTELRNRQVHLTPDEVEAAAERSAALPGPRREHVDACARCAREVAEVRHLSNLLAGLPSPAPSAGFADRVMARVTLPVPLHVRLLAAIRERTAGGIAAAAMLAALLVGGGAWATWFPELRPMTLVGWFAERAGDAFWQASIAAGRWLYAAGVADLVAAVRADLSVMSILAALATIALVSLGSLSVLIRLVRHERPELARAR